MNKRVTVTMKDGQEVEALTLTALYERLGEIIQENEKRGWGERNNNPVVVEALQGQTPTGRLKKSHYYPIVFGGSACHGLIGDSRKQSTHVGFNVLGSGPVIVTASQIKTP